MKEAELRKHATCALCENKIMSDGFPSFWRVTLERFVIDMQAIQRQQAFITVVGSAKLAAVMGRDEDMAKPIFDPIVFSVCEKCGTKDTCIALLAESMAPDEQEMETK